MPGFEEIKVSFVEGFRERLHALAKSFECFCILDGHSDLMPGFQEPYKDFDLIAGFGIADNTKAVHEIRGLCDNLQNSWWLGFLTYDVKNRFEALHSEKPDAFDWPETFFFQPAVIILKKENTVRVISQDKQYVPESIWNKLLAADHTSSEKPHDLNLKARMNPDTYIQQVNSLVEHIKRGDIYEINYCQEFFDHRKIDPFSWATYLSRHSPSPFSVFLRLDQHYLISASPERFLKKKGRKLITQPIKGTAPRSTTPEEDQRIARALWNDPKERSENIMIVDLVRNDLSRIAIANSVRVEELCKIYTFPQVHQMISTVTAETHEDNLFRILGATFPMGSMTGAPKIEAMKLAEKYEIRKRGLYSGAVGYISPDGDFDFNVVIRSLQYRHDTGYLSYMTGSAITALSDPVKEYEECLLKAYGFVSNNLRYDHA